LLVEVPVIDVEVGLVVAGVFVVVVDVDVAGLGGVRAFDVGYLHPTLIVTAA
jgi:hypothetical protein